MDDIGKIMIHTKQSASSITWIERLHTVTNKLATKPRIAQNIVAPELPCKELARKIDREVREQMHKLDTE